MSTFRRKNNNETSRQEGVDGKYLCSLHSSVSNQPKAAAAVVSLQPLSRRWQWINAALCQLCAGFTLIGWLQRCACRGHISTRPASLRGLSSHMTMGWSPSDPSLTALPCALSLSPASSASDSGRRRRQPVRVSQSHAAPTNCQSGKPLVIGHHQRWGPAHRPQQLVWHTGREWVSFGQRDHKKRTLIWICRHKFHLKTNSDNILELQ